MAWFLPFVATVLERIACLYSHSLWFLSPSCLFNKLQADSSLNHFTEYALDTDFCWWPSISFPLALRTAFDTHILLPEEPALLDRSFSTHIFPSLLLAHFSSSSSYILILESSPLPLGSDLAPRHFSIQIHIGTFIILSQFMVMQMLCMLQPPHLCLHSGSSTWPLELEAKYIKANGDFFLVKIFFWCGSFLKSLLNLLQYGFR